MTDPILCILVDDTDLCCIHMYWCYIVFLLLCIILCILSVIWHLCKYGKIDAYAYDLPVFIFNKKRCKIFLREQYMSVQVECCKLPHCIDTFNTPGNFSEFAMHINHTQHLLQVNVWDKQKTFDRKQGLGEAVVRLDSLDLSQHTMAWYKLFPLGASELGSVDSLNYWPPFSQCRVLNMIIMKYNYCITHTQRSGLSCSL